MGRASTRGDAQGNVGRPSVGVSARTAGSPVHRRCGCARSGFRQPDDLVLGGGGVVDRHPNNGEVLLDHEARLLSASKDENDAFVWRFT
jgi:hypothetical protein